MNKHIVFRIIAALVLLAAIAGIAGFAYNAGMMRGAALNLQIPAGGQTVPGYAYGLPFMHRMPFLGLGFLGLLFPVFLFFLAIGAVRRMLWGPRFGCRHIPYMQHAGRSEHGPAESFPSMFDEWHDRAHRKSEKPAEPETQK